MLVDIERKVFAKYQSELIPFDQPISVLIIKSKDIFYDREVADEVEEFLSIDGFYCSRVIFGFSYSLWVFATALLTALVPIYDFHYDINRSF